MNKERILQLAEHLESLPERSAFNLGSWGYATDENSCGTVGCIAGWASILFSGQKVKGVDKLRQASLEDIFGIGVFSMGREFLELNDKQASELFMPRLHKESLINHYRYMDVHPRQAAAVLRHLAETGKVDWEPVKKCFEERGE